MTAVGDFRAKIMKRRAGVSVHLLLGASFAFGMIAFLAQTGAGLG